MKLISFIVVLLSLQCYSQDLMGTWKGKLYQEPSRTYTFEIRVDAVDINGKVTGTTFVKEESSGNFGTISFKGTFKKPNFTFDEIEIVKQDKENNGGYYSSNYWFWCIKKGNLVLSEKDGLYYLKGPWSGAGGCDGGTLEVSKKKNNEELDNEDCITTSADFMIGAWRGKFHQHGCNVFNTYPMVVLIDRIEGKKFYGQFIWTDMQFAEDSRSTLEGEIKDGFAYFYENKIISGSGLVLNGTYKSKIINCDQLSGHWYLDKLQPDCNDPQVLKNGGDYDLEHYIIPTIYFDHNSSKLRPKSVTELNEFAKFMKQFPSMHFEMSGHTDNSGNSAYNMILSRERAQIVIDFLVSKGIPAKRFNYTYHAHSKPFVKNSSEQNKQLNRRTEIVLLPGK